MMKRVWIGLVHLRPEQGCELINQNSFVQVVAFVKDAVEFSFEVKVAAEHYKMTVVGIEDLEPFEDRHRSQLVAAELKTKAEEAKETGCLRFGTFHSYRAE
jgi:hypothetical protein